MAGVSIPVSNLLSYGTGAQTNRNAGSTPGGAAVLGVSDNEWVPIFTAPGESATLIGFRSSISGQSVPLGRGLSGITRAQYEQRRRQEADPIGNERGDRRPRPTRGGSRSSSGGGGGGGGGVSYVGVPGGSQSQSSMPSFYGTSAERLSTLDQSLSNPGSNLTGANGELRPDVQAELIKGLDLDQFTPSLVARLSPTASVNFLVWNTGSGTAYIDALYVADLSNANLSDAMNSTTALAYAALGIPVGRIDGAADGIPVEWLVKDRGVWLIGTDGEMQVVTSERGATLGNLTAEDIKAHDWVLGIAPENALPALPDLTVRN